MQPRGTIEPVYMGTDGDAYVTKGLPCKNERNRAGLKIKLIKS